MVKSSYTLSWGEESFMSNSRYNRFEYVMATAMSMGPLFLSFMITIVMALLELERAFWFFYIVDLLLLPFCLFFFLRAKVRRLHDIGHSGWYLLLDLIPAAAFVLSLYLLIKEGEEGKNEYDPHYDFEKILKIYPEDYSVKRPMVRIFSDIVYINGVKINYNSEFSLHVLKKNMEKQPALYNYVQKNFNSRTDQARIYFELTAEQFHNLCRLPGAIVTHEDEFVEYKGLLLRYAHKNFRHRLTYKVTSPLSPPMEELNNMFPSEEEELGERTLFLKRRQLIELLKGGRSG